MSYKALRVWNPDSPGMHVWVVRNWWQRLLYPKSFATIGETLRWYALSEELEKQ